MTFINIHRTRYLSMVLERVDPSQPPTPRCRTLSSAPYSGTPHRVMVTAGISSPRTFVSFELNVTEKRLGICGRENFADMRQPLAIRVGDSLVCKVVFSWDGFMVE